MDPIIGVEHLTKRYKKSDTPAVDDITFDVARGELFAFLGPNGAGKTTTISILTTTLANPQVYALGTVTTGVSFFVVFAAVAPMKALRR